MSAESPTDEEFTQYSRFALEKVVAGGVEGSLILTEGGALSAKQRAQAVKTMEGQTIPVTAVVSTSAVMRGIVTALSWMRSDASIKVFKPADLEEAFAFLKISGEK